MKKLIINYTTREKRFALINEKNVEKILIEQPQQQTSVGNIYFGIVTKVLPGMNAVFIDIGEEKNGYLQRDKLPSFFLLNEPFETKKNRPVTKFAFQGERLLVQVEKDATGTKGPRLTGIIELHGSNVIYLPKGKVVSVSKKIDNKALQQAWQQFGLRIKSADEGLIFRTSVKDDEEHQAKKEIEELRNQYENLTKKAEQLKKPGLLHRKDFFFEQIIMEINRYEPTLVYVDDLQLKQQLESTCPDTDIHLNQGKENIFSVHQIEHEIQAALHKTVYLENGAYLVFDETEALTIIDVNTGKFSGKTTLGATVLQTNLMAAEEIIRQVRLRDIGGIILVDFIDMKTDKERQQVVRKIEHSLRQDERRTRVIGFTPLGILQLTRKKTKVALSEALTAPCPVCEGTGRVLSSETMAFRLERELWEHRYSDYEAVWIETTEEVCSIFCGEQDIHLERLQESLGLKIMITVVAGSKPTYLIRQFGSINELETKTNHS